MFGAMVSPRLMICTRSKVFSALPRSKPPDIDFYANVRFWRTIAHRVFNQILKTWCNSSRAPRTSKTIGQLISHTDRQCFATFWAASRMEEANSSSKAMRATASSGGRCSSASTRDSDSKSSIKRCMRPASPCIMVRNCARLSASSIAPSCKVSIKPTRAVKGERRFSWLTLATKSERMRSTDRLNAVKNHQQNMALVKSGNAQGKRAPHLVHQRVIKR